MEWAFKTVQGQEYFTDASDYELSRMVDASRPSEAKLVIPRSTPVIPKGWVRAIEDGKTLFIGTIVKRPSISGAKQTVQAKGVEAQLFYRYFGRYGYMGNLAGADGVNFTRLSHIFSDQPPNQGYDKYQMKGCLGAIWYANSKFAPGREDRSYYRPWPYGSYPAREAHGPSHMTFYSFLYRFPGAGTVSRIGNANIYINGSLIPNVADLNTLETGSTMGVARDANDLWIRIQDNSSGVYAGVDVNNIFFADNAFDTLVRTGVIDKSDEALYGPLDLEHTDAIGDALLKVAEIHDLNARWRYENDYHCYLDAVTDFYDDGVFDIKEEDCDKIEFNPSSDFVPDALIGLGFGSKEVRQTHSIIDLNPGMGYFEQYYEANYGWADASGNFPNLLNAEWQNRRNKDVINVSSKKCGHLIPGRPVMLRLLDDIPQTLKTCKITWSKNKPTIASLGNRENDIADAMKALKGASNIYIDKSMVIIGYTSTMTGNITIGDQDTACTPYTTGSFTLPALVTFSADNVRFVLDISIRPTEGTYDKPVYCSFGPAMYSSTTGIDSYPIYNGATQWYLLGDSITGIDATSRCNWGGANYIRVTCLYRGYWADTPPQLTCSVKGTMYGRYNL